MYTKASAPIVKPVIYFRFHGVDSLVVYGEGNPRMLGYHYYSLAFGRTPGRLLKPCFVREGLSCDRWGTLVTIERLDFGGGQEIALTSMESEALVETQRQLHIYA